MGKCILVGCDLHDKTLVLKVGVGRGQVKGRTFANGAAERVEMIAWLKQWAAELGGASVYFVYEASGQGFGLYDELTASGIRCFVVPPTHVARSSKDKKTKTDPKDAKRLLELLRGHVLAGNDMPQVWVPDRQTRDDREVVRARGDVADKIGGVKRQIRTLLKRTGIAQPEGLGVSWTKRYRAWLAWLCEACNGQPFGVRTGLGTLVRQLTALESERSTLDEAVKRVSQGPRYAKPVEALCRKRGVGLLTAMTFLTEMGDLSRFHNRRQVGAFLGLVPSSNESGDAGDRKGHITRQGPSRVRKALCQAVHAYLRGSRRERAFYERLVERNPKRKQKAVVACMRRLGIRLWHIGRAAQQEAGVFSSEGDTAA
jgi:transposase